MELNIPTSGKSIRFNLFFSDFFNVPDATLRKYGAFNISLVNDLPLFIDPFLLFDGEKPEYKKLHEEIITYLVFLKSKSEAGSLTPAQIKSWYSFSEVKQNWLGYSVAGNSGSGLGNKFGKAMSSNMHLVFADLNAETITTSSHLEKAGLFDIGVGKDNISDFTCNLIKGYLLNYTETFAKEHIDSSKLHEFMVNKVYFDYEKERWASKKFMLPRFNDDFVILTPREILNKDDNWINSNDLKGDFVGIYNSIPNDQLKSEINAYFQSHLPAPELVGKGKNKKPRKPTQQVQHQAILKTIQAFPTVLDYYIKKKEDKKADAKKTSKEKVDEVEVVFMKNVVDLITQLLQQSNFYEVKKTNAHDEALERVNFLKDVIENKDGYRLFYYKDKPIQREADLQVIYRLTWFASPYDVNREVNNGRGPVDYSISKGSNDKSLVEFKLASNSKLKMNLENQVKIYEAASNTNKSIKVILYFDHSEYLRVQGILRELGLEKEKSIVLIDAGNDKPSASNAKAS